MKITSHIGYRFLKYSCMIVGWLPDWVLYHPLQDFIYFVAYKVLKYRLDIVRLNLANSFPDATPECRLEIERRFYRNLSEIFVDTIDLVGISHRDMRERVKFDGVEEHRKRVEGVDWIAAMAHYGSWEYYTAYQLYDNSHKIAAVYRPLHSEVFDRFFKDFRTRVGAKVVPMANIMRHVIRERQNIGEGHTVLGMIADQFPPSSGQSHIFTFLNQPTTFFTGIEKIAIRFGMPVYFVNVQKTKRAHYQISYEIIYDGSEQVEENEITQRYVDHLERMIQRVPELWLWSHRRWKHFRK